MAKIECPDISEFPKPGKTLLNFNVSDILDMWTHVKHEFDRFRYTDKRHLNDIRSGYIQFMDDADKFIDVFRELILDITTAMEYYKDMREHALALSKIARQYQSQIDKFNTKLLDKGIDPVDPLHTAKVIEEQLDDQSKNLQRRKSNLDKVEEEIAITEDKLAKKKSEMEKALLHRYTLTEKQKTVLLDEKDMILDGIEEWGSISGALSHNKKITSKASTIMMYCGKFPEFGEAINVSKQLFKDHLQAVMVERAIEGTENPIFGKGEYIGDYKIKDNKLLLELLKAKVPEEYNKKSVEVNKAQNVNDMRIISYAEVDETKDGFTRNVGVVLDVDDTGKVKRITQEKKMREYYEKKEGAVIIEPEEQK